MIKNKHSETKTPSHWQWKGENINLEGDSLHPLGSNREMHTLIGVIKDKLSSQKMPSLLTGTMYSSPWQCCTTAKCSLSKNIFGRNSNHAACTSVIHIHKSLAPHHFPLLLKLKNSLRQHQKSK